MSKSESRDRASSILRRLQAGTLLPRAFEQEWPRESGDLLLKSLGLWIWSLYDDESNDPIVSKKPAELAQIVSNALKALQTETPFTPRPIGFFRRHLEAIRIGVEWRGGELPWHERWPLPK